MWSIIENHHGDSVANTGEVTVQIRQPPYIQPNARKVRDSAEQTFQAIWEKERALNKKLGFYNSVKKEFKAEPYLSKVAYRKCRLTAKLRTSSHMLGIERGRHGSLRLSHLNRLCSFCSTSEQDVLKTCWSFPLLTSLSKTSAMFYGNAQDIMWPAMDSLTP